MFSAFDIETSEIRVKRIPIKEGQKMIEFFNSDFEMLANSIKFKGSCLILPEMSSPKMRSRRSDLVDMKKSRLRLKKDSKHSLNGIKNERKRSETRILDYQDYAGKIMKNERSNSVEPTAKKRKTKARQAKQYFTNRYLQ